MSRRTKIALAVVLPLQVLSAVTARRDLASRPDELVRGSKRFWRVFVVINPGNGLVYWLIGRRRTRSV